MGTCCCCAEKSKPDSERAVAQGGVSVDEAARAAHERMITRVYSEMKSFLNKLDPRRNNAESTANLLDVYLTDFFQCKPNSVLALTTPTRQARLKAPGVQCIYEMDHLDVYFNVNLGHIYIIPQQSVVNKYEI